MSKIKSLSTATTVLSSSTLSVWVDKEINDGSITPRTLVGRDFGSTKLPLVTGIFTPNQDDFYVETYEHTDGSGALKSSTLRFGINVYNPTIIALITPSSTTSVAPATPAVSGAASVSSSGAKKSSPQLVVTEAKAFSTTHLSPQEKYLCEQAIHHLSTTSTLAVVLDIFARNTDGSIKIDQKDDPVNPTTAPQISVPAVHGVTLYKQPASSGAGSEFLLLDPSNSSFSYILATAHPDIRLCFPSEPIKIYKTADKVKTGPDTWRDCVDVAVKLAFLLEYHKDVITTETQGSVLAISQRSLTESPSVKVITNQYGLYGFLPKIAGEYPIRAHQSSDVNEASLMAHYLKMFKKLTLEVEKLLTQSACDPWHVRECIAHKYDPKPILTKKAPHTQCISELKTLCEDFTTLKDYIDTNPGFISEQECAIMGEVGLVLSPLL